MATDETTDPSDVASGPKERDSKELEEVLRKGGVLQRDGDIEKIIVTGEKQSDTLTSSKSFTAGDLQALRNEDIDDLADYTPS